MDIPIFEKKWESYKDSTPRVMGFNHVLEETMFTYFQTVIAKNVILNQKKNSSTVRKPKKVTL